VGTRCEGGGFSSENARGSRGSGGKARVWTFQTTPSSGQSSFINRFPNAKQRRLKPRRPVLGLVVRVAAVCRLQAAEGLRPRAATDHGGRDFGLGPRDDPVEARHFDLLRRSAGAGRVPREDADKVGVLPEADDVG
jgi:hypothetical protein